MDTMMSSNFIEITKMVFNMGYSFLTGFHYPGLSFTPLILFLTGSAILFSIRFLHKVLVEV